MRTLTKINRALRANRILYMASSAMIALTIQFIGLELHKRAQAARERKAQAAQDQQTPDLAASTQSASSSAPTFQGGAAVVQLRPSR